MSNYFLKADSGILSNYQVFLHLFSISLYASQMAHTSSSVMYLSRLYKFTHVAEEDMGRPYKEKCLTLMLRI
jgi:hypothetical protein